MNKPKAEGMITRLLLAFMKPGEGKNQMMMAGEGETDWKLSLASL